MGARRIEPILAEIMTALDGIDAATAGKTLEIFVTAGYFAMASSAASRLFLKPRGISRTI